ncbi:Aly/REF export factor 2 [Thelohanellus kitauei]|uniref:Aly/REF export factor 2 n=1 Tax=Thelohanellus kitauei TaxID=669202 RepID=A0A0C2MY28_THEKT|nr:Aly/REF export factor 2 [Thelohanellus kitauei]
MLGFNSRSFFISDHRPPSGDKLQIYAASIALQTFEMMHIDLPLEEIISKEKSSKRGRGDRRTQMGGRRRFPGGRRNVKPLSQQSPQRWQRKQNSFKPDAAKKILVSNLSFDVNDDDIYELFCEIGGIKKSMVNYDRSGRSHGTAEIIFYRREDAAAAIRRYNSVPLDGRPMKIEYVSTGSNIDRSRDTRTRPFSGPRFNTRGNGNRGRFNNSFVRKAKNARPKRLVMTKETLDAELEAYKRAAEGDNL